MKRKREYYKICSCSEEYYEAEKEKGKQKPQEAQYDEGSKTSERMPPWNISLRKDEKLS